MPSINPNPHAFVPTSTFVPSAASSSPLNRSQFTHPSSPAPAPAVARPRRATPSPHVSSPSMLFSTLQKTFGRLTSFSFFQRKDVVALPQDDLPNAARRAVGLVTARQHYVWDKKAIVGASMMHGIPEGEDPSLGWIEQVVPILLRIGINVTINSSEEEAAESPDSLTDRITILAGQIAAAITTGKFGTNIADDVIAKGKDIVKSKVRPNSGTIAEHKELFENLPLPTVSKGNQFLEDDVFGWYRIAGPNPMRLTKCPLDLAKRMFPDLSDDTVRGVPGFDADTLADMAAENRLYYVSYPEFEGVKTGPNYSTGETKKNYLYAPSCLLAVPKQRINDRVTILPLAIRCGQDVDKFPVYTANPKVTDGLMWQAAKVTVQVADAVIHETVYHLSRTHLMLGIFICSTHRALSESHPVYRLLKCHFYGTAFINYMATTSLINEGGTIDQITAPDINVTKEVCTQAVNGDQSFFNDWFLDVDLKARGVTDEILPYPYRDDAVRLWDAIHKWVGAYLSTYYKSDADVAADTELANWCSEVSDADKGNLHGFGDDSDGKVHTLKYLTRAVAHVIFTATAQHAAVNFPQGTMMIFAPSMPLAGYWPALTKDKEFSSMEDYSRKMLPTLDASEKQLTTAEMIGVCQYTKLGDYGRSLDFLPESARDAMKDFEVELGVIGGEIRMRNKVEKSVGLPTYEYLVPTNIPNSINV